MGTSETMAAAENEKEMELSVVVPTYNETKNIRPLCERLFKACRAANITVDLWYMDDESSGTPETEKIVEELRKEGFSASIHVRRKGEGRGLSSAVLLGFDRAKYDTMLCMDADLQHEPEAVPGVAAPVLNGDAEFSMGSRYVSGGGFGFEWSFIRRAISLGATALCKPLTSCTDPMSGFFCVNKATLARGRDSINPIGFKIALEIMVRCRCKKVQYLQQLAALYWDRYAIFLILFFLLAVFVLYK